MEIISESLVNEMKAFDALTGRVASVFADVQGAPQAHADLYQQAFDTALETSVQYLKDHTELVALYTELGQIAVSTDGSDIDEQEASLEQLQKYVQDGLLAPEAVEEPKREVEKTKLAMKMKTDLDVYHQIFGSIATEQKPKNPTAKPPRGSKPRRNTTPSAPIELIDLGPDGVWRRTNTAEAIRIGLMSPEGTILIGVTDLHKVLVSFALKQTDPNGFTMESIRKNVPLVRNMDESTYTSFKHAFPRYCAEIVADANRRFKLPLQWTQEGEKRARHYQLLVGFKTESKSPNGNGSTDSAPRPARAHTEGRTANGSSRPNQEAMAAELRFRQAATFVTKLVEGIDQIINEVEDDRTSRVKHVTEQVADRLEISYEESEQLCQQLLDSNLLFKINARGSKFFSVHRGDGTDIAPRKQLNIRPAQPVIQNGSHNGSYVPKAERPKDDMTISEDDCIMTSTVFDLLDGREDRVEIEEIARAIRSELGITINFNETRFLLDKLKYNGCVFIDYRDIGERRSVQVIRMSDFAKDLWRNDRDELFKQLLIGKDARLGTS